MAEAMRPTPQNRDRASITRSPSTVIPGAGKLVVMSNRAPIHVVVENGRERIEPTVGGVGTSFLRLLENHGGVWIAWSGRRGLQDRLPLPTRNPRFWLIFANLSENEITHYYYGMCNRGLWPLMHFMPINCHFDAANWKIYRRVNTNFARVALAESQPDDVVWVQDFHLALVPKAIRDSRPAQSIGLFWHTPFPPEDVFRIFPWSGELLEGMLGADLVGFQTASFARHFIDCCAGILRLAVDRDRGLVFMGRRAVQVGAFPIGIHVEFFAQMQTSVRVRQRVRRIRRALHNQMIVLGVDRLDYTKGLIERLLAFERFLESNPEYRRRVTLVQIAVPSRTRVSDYIKLKRDLDELVGRIIGRFSSEGWVPIRYLYDQFGVEELVAYYQTADVALVTPLRDGMNLVAKEYVASRSADNGVLILSELAGAAEELGDALLVNPYDIDQVAEALKTALEMSPEEKARRMLALREAIARNSLERWSESFLAKLGRASGEVQCNAGTAG